ncbi:MAG: tetratricopeptide repeat protein [Oligoflexales bacterium]|nr:tetratricopeptide repeat protein [Oligoflexales bacterium]
MATMKVDAKDFYDDEIKVRKSSETQKKNIDVGLGDFDFAVHTFFLLAGRWLRGLLRFYDNIFSLNENDLNVIHKNLATRYRNKGNVAKSIEYLEKICKTESGAQKDKLTLSLGELYYMNNSMDQAKSLYKGYLDQHPDELEAILGMANIYTRENDYDNAIIFYEKAIQLDQKNDYAFYRLGSLFDKKKDQQKAIEYLKSAVALDPNNIRYNQYIGFVYESMGMHAEAIPYFKKVMELESERSDMR